MLDVNSNNKLDTEFLKGDIGEDYVKVRRVTGETHARIGLSMTVFFAEMNISDLLLSDMVQKQNLSENEQMLMSEMQLLILTMLLFWFARMIVNEVVAQAAKSIRKSSSILKLTIPTGTELKNQ